MIVNGHLVVHGTELAGGEQSILGFIDSPSIGHMPNVKAIANEFRPSLEGTMVSRKCMYGARAPGEEMPWCMRQCVF